MKLSRLKYAYRESASQLHIAVGEALRNSPYFQNYRIYQEYPVSRVNSDYYFSREHFDFVLPELHLVIEAHGMQHFRPSSFGREETDTLEKFSEQKKRDRRKRQAALEAGYLYLVVTYKELKKITGDFLWDRYMSLWESEEEFDGS